MSTYGRWISTACRSLASITKYSDVLDAQTQLARVAGEMTYSGMRVGDRVFVEKIANTILRIEKL